MRFALAEGIAPATKNPVTIARNWIGLLINMTFVRYPWKITRQFRHLDLLSLLYFFLIQTWVESN